MSRSKRHRTMESRPLSASAVAFTVTKSNILNATGERYRNLELSCRDFFTTPVNGAYRILTDEAMIGAAKAEAARFRARHGMTCDDLRVGVLADDPYVTAMREAVAFPDGRLGLYNRFIVPLGIVVLPVFKTQLVVMYRYRHGTRSWAYEFPRGIIEPGESDATAVRRELPEEIGAQAAEMILSLGTIHSSSGITSETSAVFLARLSELGEPDQHEAVARIEPLSSEEFRRRVAAGAITDAPSLAAHAGQRCAVMKRVDAFACYR